MWNQGGRLSFYFYRVAGPGGIDTNGDRQRTSCGPKTRS